MLKHRQENLAVVSALKWLVHIPRPTKSLFWSKLWDLGTELNMWKTFNFEHLLKAHTWKGSNGVPYNFWKHACCFQHSYRSLSIVGNLKRDFLILRLKQYGSFFANFCNESYFFLFSKQYQVLTSKIVDEKAIEKKLFWYILLYSDISLVLLYSCERIERR